MGERVYEMREQFGSGWRMYYVQRGGVLVVMLGGGDNSGDTTLEALYKALRPGSEPRFDTVSRVCATLGVRLVAQPAHASA
jgi:hypothetical protein